MRTAPDVLENRSIGEHVRILRRADESADRIDLRVTLERIGGGPGLHVHPIQTERFHVIRGLLRVFIGEDEVVLGPGEEATVRPGTAHTFRAAADDTEYDVRIVPALRFEAALEEAYELFDSGAFGPDGPVDLERCLAYFERYADEMQPVVGAAPPGR